MKTKYILIALFVLPLAMNSCKKKGCIDPSADNYVPDAEKDNGTCVYSELDLPATYAYTDDNGNNTVNYSGQTQRLNQLTELSAYLKSGNGTILSENALHDMFNNTGDNGNGNFTFSSSKQLRDKCFPADTALIHQYFDSISIASLDYLYLAEPSLAGTLNSGSSTYLFSAGGIEYAEVIEKVLMGAVFAYQATQVYYGSDKMNVDNTAAVDPSSGEHFTEMEHHWDEAFGYFGVPVNFPVATSDVRFWGVACLNVDTYLSCNTRLMNHFKRGRAAIVAEKYEIRDNEIESIRILWEEIAARQAVFHLTAAINNKDSDTALYLHNLSQAYGYIKSLTYFPLETREITYSQISDLLDTKIGTNFWATTITSLTEAKSDLNSIYNF